MQDIPFTPFVIAVTEKLVSKMLYFLPAIFNKYIRDINNTLALMNYRIDMKKYIPILPIAKKITSQ